MAQSTSSPYPFDLVLNGVGYMLEHGQGDMPLWSEGDPDDADTRKRVGEWARWDGWSGGVGLVRDMMSPQSRSTLRNTDGNGTTPAGGVDGSWGPLILSSKVVNAVASNSQQINGFLYVPSFGSEVEYYVFVSGRYAYKSTNGALTSGVTQIGDTGGPVLYQPVLFQGTAGIRPLVFFPSSALQYWIWDGTTFLSDARTLNSPKAFYVDASGAGTYIDYTAAVSDATAAAAILNSLSTSGSVLIGSDRPFTAAVFTMTNLNANVSVLTTAYWSGATSGWVTVANTDGTASAGKTMAANGTITWAAAVGTVTVKMATASYDWVMAALGGSTVAYYFIRLTVSAALDSTVSVNTVTLDWNERALRFGVTDKRLWRMRDDDTLEYTETGGTAPTWISTLDRLGDSTAKVTAMAAANGAMFVKRDRDLSGPQTDGSIVSYYPELFSPPATSTDDQPMLTWLNNLYVAHNATLFQFSPLDGQIDVVGPERFHLSDAAGVQGRITALAGDRTHFLWAASLGTDGTTRLMKYGSYRQVVDQDNVLRWERFDAWHQPHILTTQKVTAMTVWYVGSQPHLMLGTTDGEVYYTKLPKGVSPLDAGSGTEYCDLGLAYFPTFEGEDATRLLAAYAWMLQARGLSANTVVSIATKKPTDSAWTVQGTISAVNSAPANFAAVHSGYGIDIRLSLLTFTSSASPIVDAVNLLYQLLEHEQYAYQAVVKAEDGVVDHLGNVSTKTAADWDADTLVARRAKLPMAATKPGGGTDSVLCRGRKVGYRPRQDRKSYGRVITLDLVSAKAPSQ